MEDYRLIRAIPASASRHEGISIVGPRREHRKTTWSKLTPDLLQAFLRYEASNYTEHDPFRPLGYFDSYAKIR